MRCLRWAWGKCGAVDIVGGTPLSGEVRVRLRRPSSCSPPVGTSAHTCCACSAQKSARRCVPVGAPTASWVMFQDRKRSMSARRGEMR